MVLRSMMGWRIILYYLDTQFQLHYLSVDDIVYRLNKLRPAAQIFKIDISTVFQHIHIDPGDIDLLGFCNYMDL